MFIFIVVLTFFQNTELELNSNLNVNFLEEYDSRDHYEFYKRVDVSLHKNNQIYVLDAGNNRVLILDKEFKQINKFGNAGNGPGEFQMPIAISSSENFIFIKGFIINVYDLTGKYIKDIRFPLNLGINESNRIIELYTKSKDNSSEFAITTYNDKGEILNKGITGTVFLKKGEKFNHSARSVHKIKDQYFTMFNKEYKFKVRGNEGIKTYTRKYQREQFTNMDDLEFSTDEGDIESRELVLQIYLKKMGKYRDDIYHLMGEHEDLIYLRTSTNDHNILKFDIIDIKKKSYNIKKIEFVDRVLNAKIENSKLIVILKNSDVGPYFKVFNIN